MALYLSYLRIFNRIITVQHMWYNWRNLKKKTKGFFDTLLMEFIIDLLSNLGD